MNEGRSLDLSSSSDKPSIFVDGVKYRLNLTFKNTLKIIKITEDEFLDSYDKVYLFFNILVEDPHQYSDKLDFEGAARVINAIMTKYYYNGSSKQIGPVVFDWEEDADKIYSSFKNFYNIDLLETDMRWDAFNALLNNLPPESPLMTAIKYRGMSIPKDASKEYKQHIKDMKKVYRLKANEGYEREMRNRAMINALYSVGEDE